MTTTESTMVIKAKRLVKEYVVSHMPTDVLEPGTLADLEVSIVWQCKALQNWKFLLICNFDDGAYFELTYNGDYGEFYLDVYRKEENVRIKSVTLSDRK